MIEVRTQIFGPEDRETLKARRLLARSLQFQARYPEAEAELREVVNLHEKMLGPENPEALRSRWDLQITLSRMNKKADVLIEYQQILKLREKVLDRNIEPLISRALGRRQSAFFGPLFRSDPARS